MKTIFDIDLNEAVLITADSRRYKIVPVNGNFILTEIGRTRYERF